MCWSTSAGLIFEVDVYYFHLIATDSYLYANMSDVGIAAVAVVHDVTTETIAYAEQTVDQEEVPVELHHIDSDRG